MRTRSLALTLVLCAAFLIAPAPTASAQPADPLALLEQSGRAMQDVQSFRMDGVVEMKATAPGSAFSAEFSMSGQFRQPDQARITVNLGMLGFDGEIVVIGNRAWTRFGDQPWEATSVNQATSLSDPTTFTMTSEFNRYVTNLRVTDAGAVYQIAGDIDVGGAMAEFGRLAGSDMMPGMMMGDPSLPDFSAATARVIYTIERATLYARSVEMTMTMPTPDTSGGDMTISFRLTFSNFNDPAIVIEPPV